MQIFHLQNNIIAYQWIEKDRIQLKDCLILIFQIQIESKNKKQGSRHRLTKITKSLN